METRVSVRIFEVNHCCGEGEGEDEEEEQNAEEGGSVEDSGAEEGGSAEEMCDSEE